jgi:hypothetical protein
MEKEEFFVDRILRMHLVLLAEFGGKGDAS